MIIKKSRLNQWLLTSGGILKASPEIVAHHTIKYENTAIHKMLPKNDMGKNFFKLGLRVSGNVIAIGKISGNKAM